MQTDLQTYRAHVAAFIGTDNSTAGEQTLIDFWVNEGGENFLLRTRCFSANASPTLTAGVTDYTIDTDIISIFEAWVTASNTSFVPLERIPLDEMIQYKAASTAVGPPQYIAQAGGNEFILWPAPVSSTDTLNMKYVPRPVTLSSPADSFAEIPAEFHCAPEYFACYKAALYDQRPDAATWWGMYKEQVVEGRKWREKRAGVRLGRVRLNRGRRIYGNPSRDLGWY